MSPLTTAAVALVLAGLGATTTAADSTPEHTPIPHRCTAEAFKPFAARVWDYRHWRRAEPSKKAVAALRRRLSCSRGYPGHHRAIKATWRYDKAAFYAYRHYRRELLALTPYDCGATRSAIPCYIPA